MALLSISAAARQWGKSRQTLYGDNKAGRLSFSKDTNGSPVVDSSEMLRLYGEPKPSKTEPPTASEGNRRQAEDSTEKDRRIADLEDRLAEALTWLERERADLARALADKDRMAEDLRLALQANASQVKLLTDQRATTPQPQPAPVYAPTPQPIPAYAPQPRPAQGGARKLGQQLTPEQAAEAIRLKAEGLGERAIAQHLGCTRDQVRGALKRASQG